MDLRIPIRRSLGRGNCQGIGSGGGKKAIVDRTVDFAGSDSLLKQEEYNAGGDLQMYPMRPARLCRSTTSKA